MGGCAMFGCTNSNAKGYRMFGFPRDQQRRKIWEMNCKRKNFQATNSSQVCELHFKGDQFENKRADGRRLLKHNAIPNVADDLPTPEERLSVYERSILRNIVNAESGESSATENLTTPTCTSKNSSRSDGTESVDSVPSACASNSQSSSLSCFVNCRHIQEIQTLKKEIEESKKEYREKEQFLKSFLTDDQISNLGKPKVHRWADETIVLGLKLRFGLGVQGYKYLYDTGYPIPSYSTLTDRLRNYKLHFGVFQNLREPLKHKCSQMVENDRFCSIGIDEMSIRDELAFDKSEEKMQGHVTLPEGSGTGKKLLVAVIRGLKSPYKQVIGAHVTGESSKPADVLKFIKECLDLCIDGGLHVVALTSDMGNENRKLWRKVNVYIRKEGVRANSFTYRNCVIYCLPDVSRIIKNLKRSLLNENLTVTLPEEYCEEKGLPTRIVRGQYVKDLWNEEISSKQELRLLQHLEFSDLYPDNFRKINAGAAIKFFSLQSAAALETAVTSGLLPEEAMTTAHFIVLVAEWYELTASRCRKTSVTVRNKETKYDLLERFINVIENTTFGDRWKPLNAGIVMASISFMYVSEILFLNGYEFVLGHKMTQGAVENVILQVKNKCGRLPNAVQCLRALKCISISQYLTNIDNNNYCPGSDVFLADFFRKAKSKETVQTKKVLDPRCVALPQKLKTRTLEDVVASKWLTISKLNSLFNIAASTTNFFLKKCCIECKTFLLREIPENNGVLCIRRLENTSNSSKEGLHEPCLETLQLIINCEILHNEYRLTILHSSYKKLISQIIRDVDIFFPSCNAGCQLKLNIVEHYFTIRCCSLAQLSICNKRKCSFGDASAKKNKNQ